MGFRIIARHEWVEDSTVIESVNGDIRRYTATVRDWCNWRIYEGTGFNGYVQWVIALVEAIKGRIDSGDETIFELPNEFSRTAEDLAERVARLKEK